MVMNFTISIFLKILSIMESVHCVGPMKRHKSYCVLKFVTTKQHLKHLNTMSNEIQLVLYTSSVGRSNSTKMDNLHNRLTFNLGKKNEIISYS